jgi:hypothetical protein
MGKSYSSEEAVLAPAILDDETLLSIGRLVRACAGIEDIVTLHICALAGISESQARVLLGRTAVTRRLDIASYLAEMREDAAAKFHKQAFPKDVREILDIRNAVAHGILLGATPDGHFAFATEKLVSPDSDAATHVVYSLAKDFIKECADRAEEFIPWATDFLQLQPLLDIRREPTLRPHPKGRKKSRDSAKREDPPQSSEE